LLREKERKRLIKEELDNQMSEKNKAKRAEMSERQEYDKMQGEHLKLLGEKE
jgi:hypothetical protein